MLHRCCSRETQTIGGKGCLQEDGCDRPEDVHDCQYTCLYTLTLNGTTQILCPSCFYSTRIYDDGSMSKFVWFIHFLSGFWLLMLHNFYNNADTCSPQNYTWLMLIDIVVILQEHTAIHFYCKWLGAYCWHLLQIYCLHCHFKVRLLKIERLDVWWCPDDGPTKPDNSSPLTA